MQNSQELSNNSYPEPNQPNSLYWHIFLRSIIILSSYLRLVLPTSRTMPYWPQIKRSSRKRERDREKEKEREREKQEAIWTYNFKYHVSCTDGKISVKIISFLLLPTHKLCFPSCRPFIVNTTFSTGLVVFPVSGLDSWQETEETTKPVENVMLTTKGLQERQHNLWVGRWWKNR